MKPRIVKGTRDFGPEVVRKRNYIFSTIRRRFEQFGFAPIETPSMELLDTLTGKYGEEGDQLLFKVLNNGDFLKKADQKALEEKASQRLSKSICDRALRYDLTVPFARFVAMNRNDLSFPFKRYQIQPVWRADRPQKGRYREFFQCDVDVIGSDSLLYEAELCQLYDLIFKDLKLKVVLRINNRKLLEALAIYAGASDLFTSITVAIDKLDKIGWDGVTKELQKLELDADQIERIKQVLKCSSLDGLSILFKDIALGQTGIQEIKDTLGYLEGYTFTNTLKVDFTLARGLNYYTGCVFEVEVDKTAAGQEAIKMGSIGGGGRYADLTSIFGLDNMSGVGISFGADRIYDVMEDLSLFESVSANVNKVLILPMEDRAVQIGFSIANHLRKAGINTNLYPTAGKFQKLIKYANKTAVPYVIIIGSNEIDVQKYVLKDMQMGTQEQLSIEAITTRLLEKR